ncbi:hypothetical protein E1176_04135 [Fulvivirga sp. RKSG066]|uniref:hypothetical protein n=1 Tax=Fulvivirga aurantia TaxID=2529383 RepID=UPI0012BCAEDA|nr:hypothetical protein [Fulvivirga aurantia]MTI20200.1 hypothetical protein [Fulvivirga aurantia]
MGRPPEGQAERMFKQFGKKIDQLLKDLDQATDKAKEDYADRFEELKRNKESLKKEFGEFREKNKGRWDELDKGFEKAGREIKDAFSKAFSSKDTKKGA